MTRYIRKSQAVLVFLAGIGGLGPACSPRQSYKSVDCVTSIAFSCDGKLLAAGGLDRGTGVAWVWDVESGEQLHRLGASADRVSSVAFTGRTGLLATGSTEWITGGAGNPLRGIEVKLCDLANERVVRVIKGPQYIVRCMATSDDGRFVAVGGNNSFVGLWDATTGADLGA